MPFKTIQELKAQALQKMHNAGIPAESIETNTSNFIRIKGHPHLWYRADEGVSASGKPWLQVNAGNFRETGGDPRATFSHCSWKVDGSDFDDEELKQLQQEQQRIKERNERELAERRQQAAKRAQAMWSEAKDADPRHRYLVTKGVKPHGIRQLDGKLLIPVMSPDGDMASLQTINENGDKRFIPDGRKAGNSFRIGEIVKRVWLAEGYATGSTVHQATGEAVVVGFDAGNLPKVAAHLKKAYPGAELVIAADNDEAGLKHAKQCGCRYVVPEFENQHAGLNDFNDLYRSEGMAAVKRQLGVNKYNVTAMDTFVKMDIPKREPILEPWLNQRDIALIHAYRGVGKTFFGLSCAYAIASAGEYLRYRAPKPRRVLYIDGEMPADAIKERLMQLGQPTPNLGIMAVEFQDEVMANIADEASRIALEKVINEGKYEVVFIDNVQTIVRTGVSGAIDESWFPAQDWAVKMRAEGRTVVWIDHDNKNGSLFGTSTKETILDTVIHLKHSGDWQPEDGLDFEIHYTKNRSFHGQDAAPLSAKLVHGCAGVSWKCKSLEMSTKEKVLRLHESGMNNKEISELLDIHKSNVSRHIRGIR